MGLRIAILLAVIGGLALIGVIAFFVVPKRRGPRVAVLATVAGVLIVATLVVFLAPISSATQAPTSPNLSLYLTGQTCEPAPPTFNSACGTRTQTLLNLRAADGATRWTSPVDIPPEKGENAFIGAPILRDGVVYTIRGGADPGAVAATLLALHATDGSEIWRAPLDSTPLAMDVADGQVYMLLKYHEDASLVRVFSASDGAQKQQFTLPIFSGFVVTNGLIIGCDAYLYLNDQSAVNTAFAAYHASDGSLAWQVSALAFPPSRVDSSPCALAFGNGVLYQATEKSGGVTAVRLSDGKPVWQAQTESVVALGLSGERLIAASVPNLTLIKSGQSSLTSEKFTAFDLKDGRILWQRDFPLTEANGPYISATIAADDERAYVATRSGLRVFRLSDGATVWESKTGGDTPFYSYPVVAQGTLFALNGYYPVYEYPLVQHNAQASRIVALNAATGDSYWGVTVYSTGFALGED
ncbi:MAG TPA: PQQ-binding-like beta-propeller repeat protein [Ktedonobacterales bacterium]|jgi:outer membrane protein assembly factor BamB|nr:PQQ-binding-like beta-propeller repeat protein [Ktedonobacterales bacterium]